MKKILVGLLIAVVVLYIVWHLIQTKPNADIPNAGIESALPNINEIPSVVGPTTSQPGTSKQIDISAIKVTFKGFGPGKVHTGSFSKITSDLKFVSDEKLEGSISVDMTSLSTDNEKVTTHLKSADFFDTTKYPAIKFAVVASPQMVPVDQKVPTTYWIQGNLTVKGVTKQITVPISMSNDVYSSTFNINMKEFGIDQKFANETVEVTVEVPLKK